MYTEIHSQSSQSFDESKGAKSEIPKLNSRISLGESDVCDEEGLDSVS
jgi:hypothetical protein